MSCLAGRGAGGALKLPHYEGLQWVGGTLPREAEVWPTPAGERSDSTNGYEITMEELRAYAAGRPWVWPDRNLCFLCDIHADTDAFFRSLVATGRVRRTGAGDEDFELTAEGRETTFLIGGDCLDKGPENLRLLRALRSFIDKGADVEILAGNHDVRFLTGISLAESTDLRQSHLFVRMGKKCIPMFAEIHRTYLRKGRQRFRFLSEREVKRRLFPSEEWYQRFPELAEGRMPEAKIAKEVRRIREKADDLREVCRDVGMTLTQLYCAYRKAVELFVDPDGEFSWFFRRMKLAYRAGSFLFIHAGLDDSMARAMRFGGVDALNKRFRILMETDLFELYHGPIGNAFRTKYRDYDYPLTRQGVRDIYRSGIYAIVHGHRNITRGQRLVMREGILNVECDASVDANTRIAEGMSGPGGAAVLFQPDGTMLAISTDHPFIKSLEAARAFGTTAIL